MNDYIKKINELTDKNHQLRIEIQVLNRMLKEMDKNKTLKREKSKLNDKLLYWDGYYKLLNEVDIIQ